MERPEGSNEMPPGVSAQEPSFTQEVPPPRRASPPSPPKAEPKKEEPKAEPMEVDEVPEDAKAKAEANDLKLKGNAAYKARQFEEAIELYSKAWATWPKDVAFLTNLSGE
jgi:stress-induced-phosphoprotein 1